MPARGVEQDARGRLGATVAATGEVIEQGVALRVPVELRERQPVPPARACGRGRLRLLRVH